MSKVMSKVDQSTSSACAESGVEEPLGVVVCVDWSTLDITLDMKSSDSPVVAYMGNASYLSPSPMPIHSPQSDYRMVGGVCRRPVVWYCWLKLELLVGSLGCHQMKSSIVYGSVA